MVTNPTRPSLSGFCRNNLRFCVTEQPTVRLEGKPIASHCRAADAVLSPQSDDKPPTDTPMNERRLSFSMGRCSPNAAGILLLIDTSAVKPREGATIGA